MHYAWLCFVNYLFIQCMVGLEGILRIVSIVSIITVSGTMNLIMSFVIIWLLLVPINDILLWLRQEKKKKKGNLNCSVVGNCLQSKSHFHTQLTFFVL